MLPAEQGSEGEMLYNWKFREDLCIIHFDHTLDHDKHYNLGGRDLSQTLLILPHPERTPDISKSIGLCSQNGPVLTSLMNPIAAKYMLCARSRSTTFFLATSPGLGESGREPSTGITSPSSIAGQY